MSTNSKSSARHKIISVKLAGNKIIVDWSDALQQEIHSAYLKHSPGFPGGERPAGPRGRFPSGSAGLAPSHAEITETGNLQLDWQPGDVKSLHDSAWLRQQIEYLQLRGQYPPCQVLWDATVIRNLPEPAYAGLAGDESAQLELFDQLLNWGVTLIRDVPEEQNIVEQVAAWFGQVQPNAYADDPARPVLSSIRVDPTTPVATRMSHFLGPHTDTCWRQTLIGLLMMHCLKAHPEGGRSMLVDGYAVANRLRDESRAAFELLSTIPIAFGAVVADQDDWRVQGRVISVSADGIVEGIRYNGNSIGQLDLPDDLIEPVYFALEKFESILYDRNLWWRPMLGPGDLLVIDNHRVLHGREAFDSSAGERYLQCCSVERDDFQNNYRRLAKRLGANNRGRRLSAGVI